MAEKQHMVLEGNIVGVVSIRTPVRNLDSASKDQVTWAAYRAVLRACEEDVTVGDDPASREAQRHLGSTDARHYGSSCVVTLQDAMLTVHEGESEVLKVSVENMSVAVTVPGDLCRLVLVACPQCHAFTQDADGPDIVLVLTVTSLVLLGRFIDTMCVLNPQLRSPRSEDAHTAPPPKPLRASQRKKSREHSTDRQQQVSEDEPPKLTRKLSQLSISGSNAPEEKKTSTAAPACPNESGHYPLRGQLSKNLRAQDCNSGYYDEVPSGPPRRVDEAEESVQRAEESVQSAEESVQSDIESVQGAE